VPDYERRDSRQTLAEGIAEYRRANPGLLRRRDMSGAAQAFFRCHDAVHVVYGCGTSLHDEAIVKLASIFGSSGGFGVLRGYRLHEAREIYKTLDAAETLRVVAQSVVIVPRTMLRCLRQRARWPWDDFEALLDTPLAELRRRFGIRVARGA